MNSSWQFLLTLLAVGLPVGLASAQGPMEPRPVTLPQPAPTGPTGVPTQEFAPIEVYSPYGGAAPIDRPGFIAGAGFYLLQPYFQNNPAYTVFVEHTVDTTLDPTNPNTHTIGESADRLNVSHHMAVAPLVWLGYMGENGFGGRARWWSFREGTSQTVNLPPFAGTFKIGMNGGHPVIVASGDLFTVSSAAPLGLMAFGDTLGIQHGPEATSFNVSTKLALQVADLEVFQGFRVSNCDFLLAGGLRLVRIEQTYNAYDAQSGGPAELRSLLSNYNFSGVGPTLALEVRKPVGDSGLSLFSLARGALVFGSAQQDASFSGQELRNDDPNPQFASQHRGRAMPVGELEGGVEYGQTVGRSWLFGQVALVGQEWFGAGSASRSTMLTPATTLRPVLGGASLDSNIAFLGMSFRIGVRY